MCETWLEEKGWDNFKSRLPNTQEWVRSFAVKEKKKGRARGGFVIDIRKGWRQKGSMLIKEADEGLVISEIKEKGEILVIISVYIGEGGLN